MAEEIKHLLAEGRGEFSLMVIGILSVGVVLTLPLPSVPDIYKFVFTVGGACTTICGAILSLYYHRHRKVPRKYQIKEASIIYNNKCDVIHNTSIRIYTHHAKKLANPNLTTEIFTLCTFEPFEICDRIRARTNRERKSEGKGEMKIEEFLSLSKEEFLRYSDLCFDHFRDFREYQSKGKIFRILLLKPEFYKRNSIEMFEKFKWLNGDIDCRVLKKEHCKEKDWTFLTDYVIFNKEFILDYYDDAKMVVLTYAKRGIEKQELMKLRDDFYSDIDNFGLYPKLTDDYIRGIKTIRTYEEMKDKYKLNS
jgi:hypothetical protein